MAAAGETPVLDLLGTMTEASLTASSLDSRALMLVRLAALVAVDARPASYAMNLGVASELDTEVDEVRGVLAARRTDRRDGARRVGHRQHRPRACVGDRSRGPRRAGRREMSTST
jgi:hypothetical protein